MLSNHKGLRRKYVDDSCDRKCSTDLNKNIYMYIWLSCLILYEATAIDVGKDHMKLQCQHWTWTLWKQFYITSEELCAHDQWEKECHNVVVLCTWKCSLQVPGTSMSNPESIQTSLHYVANIVILSFLPLLTTDISQACSRFFSVGALGTQWKDWGKISNIMVWTQICCKWGLIDKLRMTTKWQKVCFNSLYKIKCNPWITPTDMSWWQHCLAVYFWKKILFQWRSKTPFYL